MDWEDKMRKWEKLGDAKRYGKCGGGGGGGGRWRQDMMDEKKIERTIIW